MTELVLPLDVMRKNDAARVGGKAAVLGSLLAEGFPVPPATTIAAEGFRLAIGSYRDEIALILLDRDVTNPSEARRAAHDIGVALSDLTMPAVIMEALRAELSSVQGEHGVVAVRSSATDEDGAETSLAGQYETVLGVRGEQAVVAAVLTCWRSFYSAHALTARALARRLETDDHAMAVIVQRMVDGECAGVCFTLDPVHPERGIMVIEAAWGLGTGVVDGVVATDIARIHRNEPNRIEERRIAAKGTRLSLDPNGGVRLEDVSEERKRAACLPEAWLHRIAEFGLAIEQALGRPQDIEWAIGDNQVWILQSRPITTLSLDHSTSWRFPVVWESDAECKTLWRLDGSDRDDVPTPLEAQVSDVFDKAMADANPISAWDGFPRQKVFNGRRYRCWAPSELTPGDKRVRKQAQSNLAVRMRAEGKTALDHWSPEIIAAIERLRAFDSSIDDDAKAADYLENAFGTFRRHWMIHWCLWADDKDARPFLRAYSAMTGLDDQEAEHGVAQLVDGDDTVLTRMIDTLYDLAREAKSVPEVATLMESRSAGVWRKIEQLPVAGEIREKMASFLDQYGDYMGAGYGSSSSFRRPTWRQNPDLVLAMMAAYMRPEVEAPMKSRARARIQRDDRVERLCAACDDPAKVAEFRRWLPIARREATVLEDHNYLIDQLTYGQLRTAVGIAGRRLVAKSIIADEDDVFWLSLTEIATALRASASFSFVGLLAERTAMAADQRRQTPPPLLGMPRAQFDARPPLKDEVVDEKPDDATKLTGTGASVGRRRGRARVVAMSTVTPAVEPGDILVATNAGPAWTPIFPVLGGLVLDEGAFTQHGATTAREYGVPAVIGTRRATKLIPEGAWITIDGEAGTVEIEP